jgi:CrcB protein
MQKAIKVVGWLAGNQFVLLAIAGAVGTLARYWLGGVVQRLCGAGFPWGTVVINITGCLLFGLIWTLAEDRLLISPQTRVVALTGFMGAFTTFSTFAFETAQLLSGAEWLRALGNVALQNVVGVVAVMLGFALGRIA